MLILNREQAKQLIAQALEGAPDEICGILAGKDGVVDKIYPMVNEDKSASSFLMQPQEQLKVMKEIRSLNLEMVAIYHSHPETRSYPSAHDVELAFYPDSSYIIISLQDKNNPQISSFKIIEGEITKEDLRIR